MLAFVRDGAEGVAGEALCLGAKRLNRIEGAASRDATDKDQLHQRGGAETEPV